MAAIRGWILAIGSVAALLMVPTAASAAARYASPTGSALDDCSSQSAPCSIDRAVNQAGVGDDITLLAGVPPAAAYNTSSTLLSIPPGATVHGALGARPVVNFTTSSPGSDGFFVQAGSTLRDVIANATSDQSILIDALGGTVERISAHASGGGQGSIACSGAQGAVYRDSVCRFTGPDDPTAHSNAAFKGGSLVPNDAVTLRNLTAYATNANGLSASSQLGLSVTVTATNVIAHGGATDVRTTRTSMTGSATLTLDHSNYATETEDAGPITDPNTATNTNLAPAFVNAAIGNFRETAASVGTLDLGAPALVGELDVVGGPRTRGAAPDIGAYEFVPPSMPSGGGGTTTPPATFVPPTSTPPPTKKKCKKKKHRVAAAKKCKKKKRK